MSRHIVVDPNIIISNFAYRYLGRSSSAKFSQDRHLKGIPNLVPHDNPDDSPLNSGQLKAVQHDLTEALRTETDPNKQTELLHKLGAVRRQIEHLIGQSNPAGPSASSEQARTQKNSILHQSVTSGVVNTSPFMRSNAEHQQPATPKQKTTYDAVNPVKTTPPTTSSTRGQSQYKVTTQPATTQLVTPTDDNITTGRAIASYIAILAAVTIAWTIVAKPGNNTTNYFPA